MRRINRVQRLARREEKDVVKRIFVLSIISIILIFILLTYGTTVLGKLAELVDFAGGGTQDSASDKAEVAAPILDTIREITNNEKLKITGFSPSGEKVEIYLDGEKVGEVPIESGRFEYEITLKSGENSILAKTISGGSTSDFSAPVVVSLDEKEPKLEVVNPTTDQSFFGNNRISVEGTTDADAQVFVNGFLANVNTSGHFEVSISLTEGDNNIEVKAQDEAGNINEASVRVNFRK